MPRAHFAPADIALLAAYFGITLVVGFWNRRRSTEDYLIASRSLSLPVFVATLVATWYGGILAVGELTYSRVKTYIDTVLSGQRTGHEWWAPLPTGHIYMRSEYIPDFSEDGKVAGFYVLASDLTELSSTRVRGPKYRRRRLPNILWKLSTLTPPETTTSTASGTY